MHTPHTTETTQCNIKGMAIEFENKPNQTCVCILVPELTCSTIWGHFSAFAPLTWGYY